MSEHPSVFIAEELAARGWSVADLLARMNDRDWTVNAIAFDFYFSIGPDTPELRIGDVMAEQIAQALDVSPGLLLNLERQWLQEMGR